MKIDPWRWRSSSRHDGRPSTVTPRLLIRQIRTGLHGVGVRDDARFERLGAERRSASLSGAISNPTSDGLFTFD
jgi:hypothetical protein